MVQSKVKVTDQVIAARKKCFGTEFEDLASMSFGETARIVSVPNEYLETLEPVTESLIKWFVIRGLNEDELRLIAPRSRYSRDNDCLMVLPSNQS